MTKYRIDKRRMRKREGFLGGRTIGLAVLQAIACLVLISLSPYLVPVELLLLLAVWMYLAGKSQYYTWGRYLTIVGVGTLVGLSVYFLGGGG